MRKSNNRNQHIVLVLSIILLSILSKSWRDLPKYYKNMIYVGSFNIIYYLLCRRHLVWEFIPNGINWLGIRLVHILIATPLMVLIFLSNMPRTLWRQLFHLIRWAVIASLVEYVAHKKRLILYAHGWNIFWSGTVYLLMFLYSHLFTKRPFITIILSLSSTLFFIIRFSVPFKRKHLSKYFGFGVDLYYHTFLEDLFNKRWTNWYPKLR
ncbi:hypothetical protein JOC85_001021 [Bacillus mesophilus]|uniref:CBO0543 family protein n=1 Tax=Bacillus mesophilus TaxID=1808955 RepID=UPI003B84B216|nr:hypothetical protein [Bacillus mesophilus]